MGNDGFIEILSPSALAQLKEASEIVDKLVPQIEKISKFKVPTTPSGADNSAKQMELALIAQEKAMEKARIGLQKLSDAQKDAESKRKNSINAEWTAYEKAKNKEKEASDKLLATQIANAEKVAKSEIDKNNKIIQAAEKRAEREKQIEDRKNASILAAQQKQIERQDKIDARNSRTGASSVIPGMGSKISDIKSAEKEAIALEKSALSNQKLNDAYGKLNRSRNEAGRVLQNLIASETASNSEIRKAQKEFDTLNDKVKKADQAVGNFSKNVGNYKSALSGATQLMGAFGIATGLYLAADLVKNIYQTTKELQGLDLALKMVSGTQSEYVANQAFLTNVAQKWGIELKGLTEQYTKFYTASKGIISDTQIKSTFESISKSGAVMGLTVEKQKDAFVALEQMMSKGKVTAEELRKQLGNAMPGAIRAAAMAYMELHPKIKTIQEAEAGLLAAMRKGAIDSATYVPLIAKNFEILYGIENVNKIETLQAAQNRLANSWTLMIKAMNEGNTSGLSKFFNIVIGGLTTITTLAGMLFKDENSLQKYFQSIGAGKAAEELNTYREKFKSFSEETQKFMDSEYADKQRLNIIEQQKIIKEQQALRKTILGGDRALFHLQTKIEEDALVSLGKSASILSLLKTKVAPVATGAGAGDGEANTKKRIRLNYEEAESLYNLEIARLKEQQVLQKEITDNQDSTDYTRLEARKEYSRLAVEILDQQLKKETAISLLKAETDTKKANEIYIQNKKNGYDDVQNNTEWAKAISDINERYKNETATSDINHSRAWKNLMYEDADYNEKIKKATYEKEEKLRKQTIKDVNDLNDAINKSSQESNLKISNNEKLTLKTRQFGFQEYQNKALLQLQIEKQRETTGKETIKQLELLDLKYKNLADAITGLESPLTIAHEKTLEFLRSSGSETINKGLDALGMSSLKVFTDLDANGLSTFDKMYEGAQTWGEQMAVTFQMVGDIAQDVFNQMAKASEENYAAQYKRLEEQTAVAIAFAGDSQSAQDEINRQAEVKKKEIQRKEFKEKKALAIANIAIDTAQAIMVTYSQLGWIGGIGGAIFLAAVGAAQIAMVASQQIPAYKDGTDNHSGGAMLVNDGSGSNYKETIQTPDGKIYQPNQRNVVMNAPKGTKVFTHDQWQRNLDNMLMSNNINYSMPIINNSSALTDNQVDKIVSSIQNKQEYHQTFDKNGIKNYISQGHTQKEILNNQVTFGR